MNPFFDVYVPLARTYVRLKELKKLPEAERNEHNLRGKLHCLGFSDDEIEAEVKKAKETGDWS